MLPHLFILLKWCKKHVWALAQQCTQAYLNSGETVGPRHLLGYFIGQQALSRLF